MLSLCPLTLLPCSPVDVIDAAAHAGFDGVGVRLVPVLPTDIDVMADRTMQRAIESRLAATGLKVLDIEVVRISPETNVQELLPMVRFAGDLGARTLTVTGMPGRVRTTDWELATARKFAELAEMASAFGVRPAIEFMAFRNIGTLQEALRMRELANHPNLGICIDALHFQRAGNTLADLEALDPSAPSCFHLCDAPATAPDDIAKEARYGRLAPGAGALPLGDMLRALPQDLPVGVEAPGNARADLSLVERALDVARRSRDILAAAGRA